MHAMTEPNTPSTPPEREVLLRQRLESFRHDTANNLKVPPESIDLIDLARANLAMRANVAEEGRPLARSLSVLRVL
jgi:hypothetical protein